MISKILLSDLPTRFARDAARGEVSAHRPDTCTCASAGVSFGRTEGVARGLLFPHPDCHDFPPERFAPLPMGRVPARVEGVR